MYLCDKHEQNQMPVNIGFNLKRSNVNLPFKVPFQSLNSAIVVHMYEHIRNPFISFSIF